MAIYRTISMSFWTDSKVVDDFTPEDRYFYLYLFTNPHTNLCGCYEVSIKQVAYETGYSLDSINMLLKRFEEVHNVIRYSDNTKELLLLNWHKYNWTSSDKFRKPLLKEISEVKDKAFREYLQNIADGKEVGYGIDTNCIDTKEGMDTSVTVTNTDTVTVSNISTSNDELDDAFDAFWKHYPKKVDKQKAKAAFKKVIVKKTITVDELIAAVERQKKSRQWQDISYVPNPTTWLNGSRWEDDLPEAKATRKNNRQQELEAIRQKYVEEEMQNEQSRIIADY